MLEGAFFSAYGLHGVVYHGGFGRVVVLVASGNVVFGDSGDAPGDCVGFGMVCQVVNVVDDVFWLAGQRLNVVIGAPVGEIVPVGGIGFQGVVGFGFLHAALAFGAELDVFADVSVFV